MKKIKILSAFLALVMLTSSFAVLTNAAWSDKVNEEGDPLIEYTSSEYGYETREEKLKDMIVVKEQDGYRIWYEEFTGEVAIEEIATGEFLFTNPYDVSSKDSIATPTVRKQLLSQIKLTYLDNEKEQTMYSYEEAALRGQIKMKNIKNGIRVEYTLGEDAVQRLVPRMISVERFEKYIAEPMAQAVEENISGAAFVQNKMMSYFSKKDLAEASSERAAKEMEAAYPIVKTMAVYVCEEDMPAARLKELEGYVKTYCPQYTYEELDFDNEQTGYVNKDAAPPRFTMALEYTITDNGVQVRLPANGISFDETAYPLKTISILPYMGAGSNLYTGYTFLPDGSGTLIRYEDIKDTIYTVSGQVYGSDYAYHEIEGKNAEVMRMPVFGAVTNYSDPTVDNIDEGKIYNDSGFLAVITEGDSMATITSDHGGTLHNYNSVYATFTPRPSDSYDLSDMMSVSDSSTWTVTSSRRYTGSYTIKYIMLSGKEKSSDGYDPTYYGMAEAYRDYLCDTGVLSKVEPESDDIPLFIESFGSIKTTKRVLSIPVTVDAPLTTFDDIMTMTDELAEAGITNLNFKLKGFSNGGLISTMPYKLKWVKELGGSGGFEDLTSYASEKNIGIYPDFDFAYLYTEDALDGVSLKKHAVKTIDDRYTTKKEYDPAIQDYASIPTMMMTAISPSAYDYFYSKLSSKYSEYENSSISLSTLGSDLNSDFDKSDPYHREDNKNLTKELLARASSDYENVMVSGGNAYSYEYADVITDIPLTSSDYINASESIPFIGMVLHGSKVIVGTPLNMEGDISEALLRSIENGAAINFTLSYQNTDKLKENEYWRKYYSVAYDIWKEDLIEYYNILNDAVGDLQSSYIVGHDFISGKRIPDEDELEADRREEELAKQAAEEAARIAEEKAAKRARRNARLGITDDTSTSQKTKTETYQPDTSKYNTSSGSIVRVEYEGGVNFILNYNSFDVTVEYNGTEYTIEAMNFVRIG